MEEMSKNQHETDGLMKKKSAGILPSFGLLQNQQLFLVGVLRLFTAKRDDRRGNLENIGLFSLPDWYYTKLVSDTTDCINIWCN